MSEGINLAKAYVQILPSMEGITGNLADTLEDALGGGVTRRLDAALTAGLGRTLTESVARPLLNLGSQIVSIAAEYEAGMSRVQAISGATGAELAALSEKALAMAASTKFSTSESAQAYAYMAMAGWDASQMLDGLAGVMNLAAASGEDLAVTADIVTDALTAFGLRASDSGRFADVLAAASANANTSVAMLGEAFRYAAPIAGALGVSAEDTAMALGLMANQGVKSSQAGTALRTIFTALTDPIRLTGTELGSVTVQTQNADGTMRAFRAILEDLRGAFGGMTDAEKAQNAEAVAGKYAMSGFLALVNSGQEDVDALASAIDHSAGLTREMAEILQDNAAGALTRLDSAVNVLFTSLGASLLPILTDVVEWVTGVVNAFNELDGGAQRLILAAGALAIAAGPVLTALGGLISAAGALGGVLTFLAASPIAVCAAAAALLAAGLAACVASSESARDTLRDVCQAVAGFFSSAAESVTAAFSSAAETLSRGFAEAWRAVSGAWEHAGAFFSAVWSAIRGAFSGAAEWFSALFTQARGRAVGAWSGVRESFSAVWEAIRGAFRVTDALKWGRDLMRSFMDGIASEWGALRAAVSRVAGTVRDYLGFSEPKKGPLSDFHTFAPDMMALFAEGVCANAGLVTGAVSRAFAFDRPALDPEPLRRTEAPAGPDAGAFSASGGGNTFNFYSPEALDPVSAARELRRAAQALALDYL